MAGLDKSRVGTAADMHRLGAGVAFPGIDPRVWVSLGSVVDFAVAEDGVFADVLVYYDNQVHTARVGTVYAGNGWGLYAPLAPDDEVTVGYPGGCPDNGLTIIGRSWSKPDPPPQLARDHPADLVLVVQAEKNMRLAVSGGGEVLINGGKIRLADGADEQKVVRKGDQLTASAGLRAWAAVVEGICNGVTPLTFTPANNFAGVPGAPTPANPGTDNNLGSNTQGSDTVLAGD